VYLDALVDSVREVWGHELTAESFARADHRPGETAMPGVRHLLLAEGLERGRIDVELRRWCDVFSVRYVGRLDVTPTPHWELAPRAVETLEALRARHEIALLTGNPEPVARARIARLGLALFFPPGGGAFGCEAEARADLIALARERAGGTPRDETFLVGDTPRDVEGAHAAGVRAIAVTTGEYDSQALAGADLVLPSIAELPAALAVC
jgi:phosphoglycolate phosphatase-like HAD superfamily hydrolase